MDNYNPNRFARLIQTDKTIAHATFDSEPTEETVEALKTMIDLAYNSNIKELTARRRAKEEDLQGLIDLAKTNKPA